jgi:hypothetical protein
MKINYENHSRPVSGYSYLYLMSNTKSTKEYSEQVLRRLNRIVSVKPSDFCVTTFNL